MGFAGETFVIKLVLSIICGFLIGLEREAKDRPLDCGHMIVCIASMLVMTIGIMQKDHYITISPIAVQLEWQHRLSVALAFRCGYDYSRQRHRPDLQPLHIVGCCLHWYRYRCNILF